MDAFSAWVASTALSHFVADRYWLIPILQTVHILSIAVVMLSVTVLNLRVLGVAGRSQSVSRVALDYLPWIWTALGFLLVTGTLLAIAEPARNFGNGAFQLKMMLTLTASGITLYYARKLRRDPGYFDPGAGRRGLGMTLASVSLFCWLAIVVAGRLIAYSQIRLA